MPSNTPSDSFAVRNSSIHGKGVFSTKFCQAGTSLGYYTGVILTEDMVGADGGDYLLELSRRPSWIRKKQWEQGYRYVDAIDELDCLGRYINGSKNGLPRANAVIGMSGKITLLRDLPPNTEIIVDYGEYYWI